MGRRFSAMRKDDREAAVQGRCVKLYRSLGFTVWVLSQGRRTRQTPGLPDLMAKHLARKLSFTHETKTEDGRLSEEQKEFAQLCEACGDKHVVGGYEAAVTFLQGEGFIAPGFQP